MSLELRSYFLPIRTYRALASVGSCYVLLSILFPALASSSGSINNTLPSFLSSSNDISISARFQALRSSLANYRFRVKMRHKRLHSTSLLHPPAGCSKHKMSNYHYEHTGGVPVNDSMGITAVTPGSLSLEDHNGLPCTCGRCGVIVGDSPYYKCLGCVALLQMYRTC